MDCIIWTWSALDRLYNVNIILIIIGWVCNLCNLFSYPMLHVKWNYIISVIDMSCIYIISRGVYNSISYRHGMGCTITWFVLDGPHPIRPCPNYTIPSHACNWWNCTIHILLLLHHCFILIILNLHFQWFQMYMRYSIFNGLEGTCNFLIIMVLTCDEHSKWKFFILKCAQSLTSDNKYDSSFNCSSFTLKSNEFFLANYKTYIE